jgi:WD40 repeat protein
MRAEIMLGTVWICWMSLRGSWQERLEGVFRFLQRHMSCLLKAMDGEFHQVGPQRNPTDELCPSRTSKYNVTLEALLMGHEAGLTNVHWSPYDPVSDISPPHLLSSSSDNSMIIWSPSTTDGIWVPDHRFGAIGGRGLAFYGALWGKEGKTVIAAGWNGGLERWVKEEQGESGSEGDKWEPASGVTGHYGGVASLTWDPKGDYLLTVG